jgi:hypothetical protein
MIERLYFGQQKRLSVLGRVPTVNIGSFVPMGKYASSIAWVK